MIRSLLFIVMALAAAAAVADPAPADLRFVPDLVIGADEAADAEYLLATVGSVVEDSHGNVYVAESRLNQVLAFAPDGAFLMSLGKAGDGPGDLMTWFVLAIDARDRIHLAGIGGRVATVATDWTPVSQFSRQHPAAIARGLAALPDGGLVIAAADTRARTALDLYDAAGQLLASVGFLPPRDPGIPPGWNEPGAGGLVASGPDGRIVYAQMAPFMLQRFTAAGVPIDSTTAGGADFVPPFPPVERTERGTIYHGGPMVNGLAVLSDGSVVVTAVNRLDEDRVESLCCLYDADLRLQGRHVAGEWRRVVGAGADGRVFFAVGEPGANRVERAVVEVVGR